MKPLPHRGSGIETSETNSVRKVHRDEFFQKIYQHAPTGIAITDRQGVFQECNPAYCALLGYSEDELRSIEFAALIHPEDREANLAQMRRLQAGEIPSFDIENRYIRKDGELVWVHKFVSPLLDEKGAPSQQIALVTNITEGARAAESLRVSEARLRLCLEAAAAGTWARDMRKNELQWDDRLKAMYGIPKGTRPSFEMWIMCIHPEDRPWVLARLSKVQNTPGDDVWNIQFRAVRPDGQIVWIQALGRAERDVNGQVLSFTGINLEITERKRREANAAFCADVTATLSQLSTVDEIVHACGARIAEFLKVSTVHYWDVDEDRNEAHLHSLWAASDVPTQPTFIRLADYLTDDFVRALRAGETTVVRDAKTDPRVDPIGCRAIKLRTAVAVPFLRDGKWRFVLSLTDQNPREWREDEVELIEELANRIFPRLERARAEDALRASEARLRLCLEAAAAGTWSRDLRTKEGHWDERCAAIYGLPKSTPPSMENWLSRIHPDDRPRLLARLNEVGKSPTDDVWNIQFRAIRPDGSMGWVQALGRVERDATGQMLSLSGISLDITERKQAEQKRREIEQQLQLYLDHAGDGIYVLDCESGRILNANKRGVQMLGYSQDELLKLCATDVEVAHGAAAIHVLYRRTRHETVSVEGIHRRKDGSTFPVEMRLTTLAPAQPGQVLAIVRDITERKQAEEAVLEEVRRKDEFLALLGHELRNPLAAISAGMQVLSGDLTAARRADIEAMMGRQVILMRRLLDDLLELGRMTHGLIELKKERIDLAEFLQKAAAAVQTNIANNRQELVLRLPAESVPFMADRMRLQQIATNLLSNASKYTAPGGRIELSGAREGSEVLLRCKDNGQGVLPEYQQKIFEPFTRGRNTYDSYGEASLGIGLALVKKLTEMHGGTISVESAGASMGSEFIVRLPLEAPPSNQREAEESKGAPSPCSRRSVAIVEDNPSVAIAMKIALEQAGHHVHVFPDGPCAIRGLAELMPDAVLLDVGLPGMDGYELAVELKKRTTTRAALLIAISGFKRREQLTGDDFDHYFTKPVDVRSLLALLDTSSRAEAAGSARAYREPEKSRRLRVLLVEDHADLAVAMAELLRREGLEVQTARTGREVLVAAPDFRPQLVLCDLNLPDMNGLEVIRNLRSNPSIRQIYAVILTAMSKAEIHTYNSDAKRLGVDEFFSKPITPEAIRSLVTKLTSQNS